MSRTSVSAQLSGFVRAVFSNRRLVGPCLLAAIFVGLAIGSVSIAMQGDTTADRELGQADFTHNTPNFVDARGMSSPSAVAIDTVASPSHVYVADQNNNRVLAWNNVASFANGDPADLVIGQPEFISNACNNGGITAHSLCSPYGLAVDEGGNLYVADTSNNRVLEYNSPFSACNSFPCIGANANRVFGQHGSFTVNILNNGGVTADSLYGPLGVAVDSNGNLYVGDTSNNRVLEYNTPLTTDTTADLVFGQLGNFTTNTAERGGITADSLEAPEGVAIDSSNNLYVVDYNNSRVLEYNTPLTTDTTADVVFGQSGKFTTNSAGTNANSLFFPNSVAVDSNYNVYISDFSNSRVLEYNTPLTSDTTADRVFGQSFFNNGNCNGNGVTAGSLCDPLGIAIDGAQNLYVADAANNRILEYNTPITTDTTADRELGQVDLVHNTANLADRFGMLGPNFVAIDTSVIPNRIYVSDTNNNRVLAWSDVTAFTNGLTADLVIGQPDFFSNSCNNGGVTAHTLCFPYGVAVDSSGHLYIADNSNNRVLGYDAPFSGCGSFPCVSGNANHVFGQNGRFDSNAFNNAGPGTSANGLWGPLGVAVDLSGNLYVADQRNNRVLEYTTPTSDTTADRVFGQHGDLTALSCNNGGVSADSLCGPNGLSLDRSGNLYIADSSNNRVLEYDTPLTTDTTADRVFGQDGSFTSNVPLPINANSLSTPIGVAVDSAGNLFISDNEMRILEYNTPLTTDTTADKVFGQLGSFNTDFQNAGGVSADSLDFPRGLAVDSHGNLYVADRDNNRVLEYDNPVPLATPTPTATATSTPTFTATSTPTSTATATTTGTATPTASSTPTASGTQTATASATATDTATATSTATATATPTATPTTSIIVPATLAMGNTPVSHTINKNLTVKNTGTNPLFIGPVTSSDPEFAATGNTTCPPGGLAHLATCTVEIGFTPTSLGAQNATLSVNDNTASSPQHVAASGTGTATLTVTPISYAFATVMDGMHKLKAITVYNYQTNSVSLSEGFTGANAGDFSVTGGTCGTTLAAKTACTLIVTFAPTATGTESGTMTVTDSPDPLSPYTVSFTASATIPESVSPKTLNYASVYQTASKTLNVTVTNHATQGPITLTGTNITGADSSDFVVTGGSTCGASLAASSSCTYAVTFTPNTETAESASLSIGVMEDPNGGLPAIPLTGTGVSPLKALPLTGLAFGTIAEGHSSTNKTVSVYNYGAATVTLSKMVTGANMADFTVTGGTCGAMLSGGSAHCTYTLKFTPSTTSGESATLGVSAVGDAASPHNVSLTGTGS